MSDRTITIKRGDSLVLDCTAWLTPPGGADDAAPRDLTMWVPACQMRHSRTGRRVELTATPSPTQAGQGRLTLSATPAATATWPPGAWHADIQFTDTGGAVASTATFTIHVLEDITP